MMIMGNHFTFQDGRSHTAFLGQLQLSKLHFTLCLDTWQRESVYKILHTRPSEIILEFPGKAHPVVLSTAYLCLEMSSDFSYNFGRFVVKKLSCLGKESLGVDSCGSIRYLFRKAKRFWIIFCIYCGRILLALAYFKNLPFGAKTPCATFVTQLKCYSRALVTRRSSVLL